MEIFIVAGIVLGFGWLLVSLAKRLPTAIPPAHLALADAGVIDDRGPTQHHYRARRGGLIIDVSYREPTVELYVDLDVDPAIEVPIGPELAQESWGPLDEEVHHLTLKLAKRRLVLRGHSPLERARLIDNFAALATDLGERLVVEVCLRCERRAFLPSGGSLHEGRCLACRARFFSPVAARALFEKLGIPDDEVKSSRTDDRLVIRCPSCSTRLSRAHIEEVEVELCTGCGGMWLDDGELSTLSGGRYEG